MRRVGGGAGAGVARGAAAAAAAGRRRRHTDAYCLRPLRATRFLPAGGTRARLPEARRRRPAAKAPRPPPRPLPGGAASKVAALRRTRQGEAGGEAARGSPPPGRAALLPPPRRRRGRFLPGLRESRALRALPAEVGGREGGKGRGGAREPRRCGAPPLPGGQAGARSLSPLRFQGSSRHTPGPATAGALRLRRPGRFQKRPAAAAGRGGGAGPGPGGRGPQPRRVSGPPLSRGGRQGTGAALGALDLRASVGYGERSLKHTETGLNSPLTSDSFPPPPSYIAAVSSFQQ